MAYDVITSTILVLLFAFGLSGIYLLIFQGKNILGNVLSREKDEPGETLQKPLQITVSEKKRANRSWKSTVQHGLTPWSNQRQRRKFIKSNPSYKYKLS